MILILGGCTLISDAEIADKLGAVGATDTALADTDTGRDADSGADTGAKSDSADDTDSRGDTDSGNDSGADTDSLATDDDGDGFSENDGDCDDENGEINPDASEIWYDGADENCDGNDGDQDGDGYCNLDYSGIACEEGTGDCADDAASIGVAINGFADWDAVEIHPGAAETWYDGIDQNCAGDNDFDADADGYNMAEYGDESGIFGNDCDDTQSTVHPSATEICGNGLDDNCDGSAGTCALNGMSLSLANAEWNGATSGDGAGEAVSFAGDFNNDGYDDALVGARFNSINDDNSGVAYLILGSASPADADLDALVQYFGEDEDDNAGYSVSAAGDTNGDGYDDVLIGAYRNGAGGLNGGSAYLILGGSTPTSGDLGTADAQYRGDTNCYAGQSAANAGDMNDDGFPDMLVGAPGSSLGGKNSSGAAYLVFGGATPADADLSSSATYFSGEANYDYVASVLAGAGDFDGDGVADAILGSPYQDGGGADSGSAYLVLGDSTISSGSVSTSAAAEYWGEANSDYAGAAVAGGGDVNADGYSDILIGAPYNADGGTLAGATYLVVGSSAPASARLSAAIQYMGAGGDYSSWAVSGADDIDGDGFADMVVGAYGNSAGGSMAGAAYIVFGSAAPAAAGLGSAVRLTGESSSDYAGSSVSGTGDMNADGYADVLVGAYGRDDAGFSVGGAYLVLGTGF